jgi:hypothetical protein
MYQAVVPVLLHNLETLAELLRKAEAHCEGHRIKPEALLNFRLYPDMLTLISQVQLASDFAKGAGARLSGSENPSFPDEEKAFADLHARIGKTITFLRSLDAGLFAGAATRRVKIRVRRDAEEDMSGADYFHGWALPQFYFHMTTAYNILRHNGVALGKADFLGRRPAGT